MALSKLFPFAVAAAMLAPAIASARADHLLISELLVNPPGTQTDEASAEYIEVFNPTADAIDLTNYYLSDYKEYYTLPAGSFPFGDRSDFMLRFPSGTMLGPGKAIVVTQSATEFLSQLGTKFGNSLASYTQQIGAPTLLEVKDTTSTVAQMINLKSAALRPNTLGLNNTGGFVAIFHWNGVSDLVQDVDLVRWGSAAAADAMPIKTGLTVDGPDAGSTLSMYLPDLGIAADYYSGSVTALKRVSSDEASETSVGGNGITGHDETTENTHSSFASIPFASISPGTPNVSLYPSSVNDWQVY